MSCINCFPSPDVYTDNVVHKRPFKDLPRYSTLDKMLDEINSDGLSEQQIIEILSSYVKTEDIETKADISYVDLQKIVFQTVGTKLVGIVNEKYCSDGGYTNDINEALDFGGNGTVGTNRQVMGFIDGTIQPVTLGWVQLSDLNTVPNFNSGALTGTTFNPDGSAMFYFQEINDAIGGLAKERTIPMYGTGGVLKVADGVSENDAVSMTQYNALLTRIGDKGWTPIHHFESDGATRQVQKLVDYIGGSGTKPTANIGRYVLDNGYTDDKSLATNFKGAQNDNLIAEYVKTGNLEVKIVSIDFDTNTFYSPNHGLTNSTADQSTSVGVSLRFNDYNELANTIPLRSSRGYVVNATQDTFQISDNVGGSAVALRNRETVNYENFRIERYGSTSFNFSNLGLNNKKLTVIIDARFLGWTNASVLNNRPSGYKVSGSSVVYLSNGSRLISDLDSVMGQMIIEISNFENYSIVTQIIDGVTVGAYAFSFSTKELKTISYPPYDNNSLSISGLSLANGATIKIYK